ncbi:chemotaxis protein CheX [Bacillus coahuilensis m2-6]|uniref:Chemotaxis protein CheX n=1 Tax=Bacillus coahuilensis p1.1.43 TaxID=1150625 RepID=A0A147K8L3_9BACI|nr:chemotaxis protein CheX [Bacillus coahuilensis]KUP06524.1 chemotaxis protein CheX [Bacillus coahuilensis p1.1.43]KUP08008.1 chemotaxis protein CheX [Bacillus coahuilensis m2-6]
MTATKNITDVLNSTIESVKSVIPVPVSVDSPQLLNQPLYQHSIGVLIGMTGDVRGRIIIEGETEAFSGLGSIMFGMPLEGEMLESFAGELGNMICGNFSTNVSKHGITTDITPPTVIVGQSKMYGFEKAIRLPITIENAGRLDIILMIEGQ